MNFIACPHCGNRRIVTSKVSRDVVVVLPCPSCQELVVLFRKKVIPLNRHILEEGTVEDKKAHIAEIITEFLEPGMFSAPTSASWHDMGEGFGADFETDDEADSEDPAISQDEMDQFIRVDLDQIDCADYFKKHFG